MATPTTNGKVLVNPLYHKTVVVDLAMGYSLLSFALRDLVMIVSSVALAIATKNMLIKPEIILTDVLH